MSEPIKVGIAVSLTGQFRVQGRQALTGIRAWVEDANRAGGLGCGSVSPRQVRLLVYDDASNRRSVRAATRQLIVGDGVDLLIGPYSAVLTSGAAEVANTYGKLLWNQGGASSSVYRRGNPWVVGILTPATEYLAGLLETVRLASPAARKMAILRASAGEFPKDVCSGVEARAADAGFGVVLSRAFDANAQDFSCSIHEVGVAEPDVLVMAGRFQNDLLFAEQLAASGLRVGSVAVVAAGVQPFQDRLGHLADGFVGPSQWETEARYRPVYGPSPDHVVASLRRAGTTTVDYPMAQAYAVGVVVQRCLEMAGTTEDSALRRTAAEADFSTFYGRFRIDATGRQIGRQVLLVQWQSGRKVIVWPPELAQGELKYPWR